MIHHAHSGRIHRDHQHWGLKDLTAYRQNPQLLSRSQLILDEAAQDGQWIVLADYHFPDVKVEYHFQPGQSHLLCLKNVTAEEVTIINPRNKQPPKFVKLEDCAIEKLRFENIDTIRCKHVSTLQEIKAINTQDLVIENCPKLNLLGLNNREQMHYLRLDKEVVTSQPFDERKTTVQFSHLAMKHF